MSSSSTTQLHPSDEQMNGQTSLCDYFSSTPIITKSLFILNCGVFFVDILFNRNVQRDSLSYTAVMPPRYEGCRIITYAFTHLSFLHILMNMMTLLQVGTALETKCGSIPFFILTGTCTLRFIYIFVRSSDMF